MPTRPRSHSERQNRTPVDKDYYMQRKQAHGPDPRSTARWRQLRQIILSRDPVCRDPFGWHTASGRVVASTQVDHIIGIWAQPDGAFDAANLQGLCGTCHAAKSGQERHVPHNERQKNDILSK